jgi:hypothetical protein
VTALAGLSQWQAACVGSRDGLGWAMLEVGGRSRNARAVYIPPFAMKLRRTGHPGLWWSRLVQRCGDGPGVKYCGLGLQGGQSVRE